MESRNIGYKVKMVRKEDKTMKLTPMSIFKTQCNGKQMGRSLSMQTWQGWVPASSVGSFFRLEHTTGLLVD